MLANKQRNKLVNESNSLCDNSACIILLQKLH